MPKLNKIMCALLFLILILSFGAAAANAKDKELDAIVNHLETKYRAKKVKTPFLWAARFAAAVVRPAGVKSFDVTLFEKLQITPATLDAEMQSAMRNSLSAEWSPLLRVRSRGAGGEQVYMYMRETGNDVRIMLVTIEKDQAVVIRARFNPDKLAEFIDNPKIFGVSLSDNEHQADKNLKPKADSNQNAKALDTK